MHTDAAAIDARTARALQKKVRLRTLDHLDGRTRAHKRASALAATFEAELGGQLSDAQRIAVQNAAALTAIAEDAEARRLAGDVNITLDDLVRTTSAARRAVRDLGLDRRLRKPEASTLGSLLQQGTP